MARRRRYGGIVSLPLGSFMPPLRGDVNALDVVVGGGLGFVGINALDGLLNRFGGAAWQSAKTSLGKLMPAVAGLAAGSLFYMAGKKTRLGAKRGTGYFWGSVAYGVASTVQNYLRGQTIAGVTFSDVVALPLGGYNYGGLLVDNPAPMNGYNGLLVDNPAPQRSNLSALGQLSMADDYDGMDALASMG